MEKGIRIKSSKKTEKNRMVGGKGVRGKEGKGGRKGEVKRGVKNMR